MPPVSLVFFQPASPTPAVRWGRSVWTGGGIHVPQEVMERAAEAVTGRQFAPHFTPSVLPGSELTSLFREVWELVAGEQGELRREEAFLLLVGRCWSAAGGCPRPPEEVRPEVRAVCDYLEAHCDPAHHAGAALHPGGAEQVPPSALLHPPEGDHPLPLSGNGAGEPARALLEQGATPLDAPCGRALPIRATSTTFSRS